MSSSGDERERGGKSGPERASVIVHVARLLSRLVDPIRGFSAPLYIYICIDTHKHIICITAHCVFNNHIRLPQLFVASTHTFT